MKPHNSTYAGAEAVPPLQSCNSCYWLTTHAVVEAKNLEITLHYLHYLHYLYSLIHMYQLTCWLSSRKYSEKNTYIFYYNHFSWLSLPSPWFKPLAPLLWIILKSPKFYSYFQPILPMFETTGIVLQSKSVMSFLCSQSSYSN